MNRPSADESSESPIFLRGGVPKKHDENIPRHPADRSGVGDVKTSDPHRQTNRPRA